MGNREMEMYRTWKGYHIRRKNQYGRWEYLRYYRAGNAVWISDYTYQGAWAEKTCKKYLKML